MKMLADLRRQAGTTLVLVTHDPSVARLAERAVTLRDGRVESDKASPAA